MADDHVKVVSTPILLPAPLAQLSVERRQSFVSLSVVPVELPRTRLERRGLERRHERLCRARRERELARGCDLARFAHLFDWLSRDEELPLVLHAAHDETVDEAGADAHVQREGHTLRWREPVELGQHRQAAARCLQHKLRQASDLEAVEELIWRLHTRAGSLRGDGLGHAPDDLHRVTREFDDVATRGEDNVDELLEERVDVLVEQLGAHDGAVLLGERLTQLGEATHIDEDDRAPEGEPLGRRIARQWIVTKGARHEVIDEDLRRVGREHLRVLLHRRPSLRRSFVEPRTRP